METEKEKVALFRVGPDHALKKGGSSIDGQQLLVYNK